MNEEPSKNFHEDTLSAGVPKLTRLLHSFAAIRQVRFYNPTPL